MATTDTLRTVVLRRANGAVLANGDVVLVWYQGTLLNGSQFDANYSFSSFTPEPSRSGFSFRLGVGQVIKGWDQGLLNRQVGEVLELTIPADLAYGATGSGNQIPPHATLRFKVEILAKQTPGGPVLNQTFEAFGIDPSGFQSRLSQIQAIKIGLDLADRLNGSPQRDLLLGLAGNDSLQGGDEADTLISGGGNDQLNGGTGDDYLDGGPGLDTALFGDVDNTVNLAIRTAQLTGEGSDILIGIESVNGGAGHDQITGNNARNSLNGGPGQDVLDGGGRRDRLTGGRDADSFVYRFLSDSRPGVANRDVITDFQGGSGDRINLSALDASSVVPGHQAFTYIGVQPFSGTPGEVRFASGLLQINVDAGLSAEMEIELPGVTTLLSQQLIL